MTKKKIIESVEYRKSFSLLSRGDRVAILETLDFYFEEESHASMRDHPLRESALSLRSLSVHDYLRILIQRRQDGGIYLLRVGDHATVYRNI